MESTTIAARKLKNASNSVATALAIAGRALRPCDVCGRERAKWYCKADEAFLCEHCDGSVHGANAVSLRHERVRVGPNGVLMNNVRRTTPDFSPNTTPLVEEDHHTNHHHHHQQEQQRHGSRKKPRSSRSHPSSKIKAEPMSPKLHDLPEEFEILIKQVDEETSHEVPVFVPLVEANEGDDDNGDVDDDDDDDYFPSSLNSIDCSSFLVPTVPCSDNQDATTTEEEEEKEEHEEEEEEEEYEEEEGLCFSRFSVPDECDLDKFLDSDTDLCDMENFIKGGEEGIVDMEEIAELGGVLGLCYDSKDFMDFTDTGAAFSPNEMSMSEEGGSGGGGGEGGGVVEDEFYGTKVKTESDNELDKIKLEVDEMLGFAFSAAASGNFGVKEEEEEEDTKKKISLRLNYEDVLNAWSDRGPFWTEGPRPQTVPDDSSFDLSLASNLDNGLVPDYGIGEPIGQVPVVNFAEDKMNIGGGREARVMRYREKRRTRLFSKKIRYEVRKLNAERRPRLKGRFVKRTLGT